MQEKREIERVVKKVSFAKAEEADIDYYAGLTWKKSAENVLMMLKNIWKRKQGGYPKKIVPVFSKTKKWES